MNNNNIDKKRTGSEEIDKIIDNMSLMDNELMAKVFDENKPATELLISTILQQEVVVKRTKGQFEMRNHLPKGRNIRLDIFAEDETGRYFDCEVQRASAGASPKRVRFHSAMLDSRMLKEGQEFDEINDSYVIFITEEDYYEEGQPLYYVDRKVSIGRDFNDGNHIIYVNGSYDSDDDIGRLLADMRNRTTEGFNNKELEDSVRHFKVDNEGRENMSEIVENYAKKYAEDQVKQGIEQSKLQSIKEIMKNLKLTAEQALDALGIPKSEHQKYINML